MALLAGDPTEFFRSQKALCALPIRRLVLSRFLESAESVGICKVKQAGVVCVTRDRARRFSLMANQFLGF